MKRIAGAILLAFAPAFLAAQTMQTLYVCVTPKGSGCAKWTKFVPQPGPQGPAGVAGRDGQSATVAIGTTTTGIPGTAAVVTNSGSTNAAVFNFTIPSGMAGKDGIDGKNGADGVNGKNGTDGTNGKDGTDGKDGPQGPPGPNIPGLSYTQNADGTTTLTLNGSLSTTNPAGDHSIILGKYRCAPSGTGLFLCTVTK